MQKKKKVTVIYYKDDIFMVKTINYDWTVNLVEREKYDDLYEDDLLGIKYEIVKNHICTNIVHDKNLSSGSQKYKKISLNYLLG